MKVYIIDKYEKYMVQGNEVSIHWVHGVPFCIREVEMEWGLPQIENKKINENARPQDYTIWEEYEDALNYIK